MFQNREEVELRAVYRDPVHDFGLYRYDPAKLRYIKPAALPLYPEGARIGTEIRVVGNDAGEQLSILAGTLARLDREAPEYGIGKYNDFNTFYIQAASGTSGGSSGSPVIDIRGRVVALNAGGSNGAQSSFYLPLGRVQRALQLIQQGQPVPRGTLQTVFAYTPYDELVRLGLQSGTQEAARRARPELTGMLVVRRGAAGLDDRGQAAAGRHPDARQRPTRHDVPAARGDRRRRRSAARSRSTVERGGERVEQQLPVEDLHAITPAEYLEFGDAVVHTLSYQMARHFNAPVRGVFVANPGYVLNAAGVPRGAVITSVGGKPVTNARRLRAARRGPAARRARGAALFDARRSEGVRHAGHAHGPRVVPGAALPARRRDGPVAVRTELPAPATAAKQEPRAHDVRRRATHKVANELAHSLVLVTFDMPFSVAGITERNYHGTGVIVDAERGLVVVDRNTVPVAPGDVRITFGGSIEVPGRVEYVHPLHNLAIVSFDPALLDGTPIRAARFDATELRAGRGRHRRGLERRLATALASPRTSRRSTT